MHFCAHIFYIVLFNNSLLNKSTDFFTYQCTMHKLFFVIIQFNSPTFSGPFIPSILFFFCIWMVPSSREEIEASFIIQVFNWNVLNCITKRKISSCCNLPEKKDDKLRKENTVPIFMTSTLTLWERSCFDKSFRYVCGWKVVSLSKTRFYNYLKNNPFFISCFPCAGDRILKTPMEIFKNI
jgi:hypothetical protein